MADRIAISGSRGGSVHIDPGKERNATLRISGGSGPKYPFYTGPTEAEALLEVDQTLETQGKVLRENVVFHGMKVRIVTNPAGGLTYYVGD